MYSRDIFPKYSSGGLPIPENYSGNAIRRTPPPSGNSSGMRSGQMGGSYDRGGGTSRVHTPTPRSTSTPTPSPGRVPLTVSPRFAAQNERIDGERESLDATHAEQAIQTIQTEERAAEQAVAVHEADHPDDGHSESGDEISPHEDKSAVTQDGEAIPVGGRMPRGQESGGLGSLLSAFLPPKPGGGGILSQIGLEEALLLGLFLLLSQSEEEEDTLMLLALLFLYR